MPSIGNTPLENLSSSNLFSGIIYATTDNGTVFSVADILTVGVRRKGLIGGHREVECSIINENVFMRPSLPALSVPFLREPRAGYLWYPFVCHGIRSLHHHFWVRFLSVEYMNQYLMHTAHGHCWPLIVVVCPALRSQVRITFSRTDPGRVSVEMIGAEDALDLP